MDLRREGFAARFGGLRYTVRRSVQVAQERWDSSRVWAFDLDDWIRREAVGWCFGWAGERVSSPVRFLVHVDGRFGVSQGGSFLEVSPSIYHLIESHALMDSLADWHPVAGNALEPWSGGGFVRRFKAWMPARPRPTLFMAWTRPGSEPAGDSRQEGGGVGRGA